MMLALLLAPLLGGLVFAASRRLEHRASTRILPDDESFAADIQTFGLASAWRSRVARHLADRLPFDQRQARAETDAARFQAHFDDHGRPILAKHKPLVDYVVPIALLATIGAFLFFIHVQLETGLIKTLLPNDSAKASLLGLVVAIVMTLLGGLLMEFLVPGDGLPKIKNMVRHARLGWIAGLGTAFFLALSLLPQLAMTRADILYGQQLTRDQAVCAQVSADPQGTPAAKSLACGTAQATALKRQRARIWDTVVSVAAPLGEAIGVWGLLRLAELAIAGVLGRRATKGQRRAQVAADAVGQRNADFEALTRRAAERAGLTPDDFNDLLGDGGDEPAARAQPRLGPGPVIDVEGVETTAANSVSPPDTSGASTADPESPGRASANGHIRTATPGAEPPHDPEPPQTTFVSPSEQPLSAHSVHRFDVF